MPEWLDIAWEDQGIKEIAGPEAEPAIIHFFELAGRPDIVSDEVNWCAAWSASCLERANLPIPIPREERLLARSYLKVGTPIDKARVGALAVLWRGSPESWQGHVGFVVGETETTIALLGGNQANSVSVQHYPKDRVLGYRWPEPPKTPGEVAAEGSRTVPAATEIAKDAGKAATSGSGSFVDLRAWMPDWSMVAKDAADAKTIIGQLHDFVVFAADKLPMICAVAAVYFLCRVAWNGFKIRGFRTEDANTGKTNA